MLTGHNSSLLVATVQAAISSSRNFLQDNDDPEDFDVDQEWSECLGTRALNNIDDDDEQVFKTLFASVCEEVMQANQALNEDSDDNEEE